VRGIDDALAVWNLLNFVNKDCAFFRQFIDDKAVVDDLPAHVDGRAEGLKGDVDDIDGAHDPGAKTAGFEQQNALLTGGTIRLAERGEGWRGSCRHIPSIPTGCVC